MHKILVTDWLSVAAPLTNARDAMAYFTSYKNSPPMCYQAELSRSALKDVKNTGEP